MEFFDSINQVKVNWLPYKKWEADQANKEFQRQELHKRIPKSKEELEKASQYGRTLIDSINIMDQYATDKAQDVEMASGVARSIGLNMLMGVGLLALFGASKIPKIKNYLAKLPPTQATLLPVVATTVLPFLALPFFNTKFASYEKEAARTARYQAREEKLKDTKNFVIYNDEQIKQAKEIAKTLPDPQEKKKNGLNVFANYGDSINSIKTIINDHKNYLIWKEQYLNIEKNKKENLDNIKVSPERLQEAKIDQGNILRAIKKIEINSQNYQSNAEMALNMILGFDLIIGGIVGGIITGTVGLLQKAKMLSAESKVPDIIKGASPIAVPILLILATTSYATQAQKEAARIGRFKAKQELLSDPRNFITYSEKEQESVKDLKVQEPQRKNLTEKLKDQIKFFMQLPKDYKEYKNYEKTQYKEEQKLHEALKNINVSEKQMKRAKALQKNAFTSFEKIDEMSQRYVADVEAATDTVKESLVLGTGLAANIATVCLMSRPSKKSEEINNLIKANYPLLMPLAVNVPAEIEAIKIQKQANKIGIMKAMKELEDPRLFVQE